MKFSNRFDESAQAGRIRLDKKDMTILTLLAKNARTPAVKIAKAVRLSRDSVAYRIRRMQEKGFLLRCVPVINPSAFGYGSYHIFLLLKEGSDSRVNRLIGDLKQNPYVKGIMEYSDSWDLEVVVLARSAAEMDAIKEGLLKEYSDIIIEKSILQTVKVYMSNYFPTRHFDDTFSLIGQSETLPEDHDPKDVEILRELSSDCRKSTYEIAEVVGMSPDTVSNRIKLMMDKKIIEKFTVIVDLNMLGFHWYTFAVKVSALDPESERRLKTFASNNRNIIRASKVLGNWDILFYILSDSNSGFHKAVKGLKSDFSSQIKSYDTWIAYKEHHFESFPEAIWLNANAASRGRNRKPRA